MGKIAVDKTNGKIVFSPPKEKGTKEKVEKEFVYMDSSYMDRLRKIASDDGFKATAATQSGCEQQAKRAAREYIYMALDNLFALREKQAEPEIEEN